MNQNNIQKVTSILNIKFYGERPSIEEIENFGPTIQVVFPSFSKEEIAEGIRNYKISKGVKINIAEVLTKHQDDRWFDKLSSNNDFKYYNRFKEYLRNGCGRSEAKIEATQKDNFITIKNFTDPTATDRIQRKGLVVGDVQAGKTENYIGLMNLAIDVGYKNIILLTGTTEELRKQTQRRIDEGLIGAHSESLLNDKIEYCGVGDNGNQCFAVSLTTYDNDFSIAASRKMAFKLSNFKLPTVFVIKKNSSVIKQVINMVNKDDENLNKDSVLIIDDECDYASLNTKKEEVDPTAINKGIRDLMSLYTKSTYVGYSATPFANIFVDPDANYGEEENSVPDLFPSDFIVLLESPSNYIGAKDMFYGFDDKTTEDGSIKQVGNSNSYIHLIGNYYDNSKKMEIIDNNFLPAKHKKDFQYKELADSLKKAIKVFLLSNCVYSLRGYEKQHRAMMINISRFNNIQEEIGHQVKNYVKNLKEAIDGAVRMSDEYFNHQPILSDMEELWENDVAFRRGSANRELPPNREYTFHEIKSVLKYEVDSIQIFITNTQHKKDRLKYEDYKGVGVRGIVIGGFTLSRGLTLVGLMTSYYSRNAMAYDTLVQMGRWFGYRDNYDDLVNIYMTQSSIDSFCAASDATEDLKVQFRRMAEEHKKPIDFGLMVREAPSTIENIPLVTARNKMRNTKDYTRTIELTGKSIDTSKIFKSRELNHKNAMEVHEFLKKISIFFKEPTDSESKKCYINVPKELVCDFLEKIHVSEANKTFDCHILSEFIQNNGKLNDWIVAIGKGRNIEQVLSDGFILKPRLNGLQGQMKGPCVQRSFELSPSFDEEDFFRVGGSKNTIVDPGIFTIGLTKEQIENAKARYSKDNPNSQMNPGARYWLYESTKPVLVIYPIDLKPTEKSEPGKTEVHSSKKEEIIKHLLGNDILYGFALGFPGKATQVLRVKYKINLVYQRKLEEYNQDEDEDSSPNNDADK